MTWRRMAGPLALLACAATVAACGTTDDKASDSAAGGDTAATATATADADETVDARPGSPAV